MLDGGAVSADCAGCGRVASHSLAAAGRDRAASPTAVSTRVGVDRSPRAPRPESAVANSTVASWLSESSCAAACAAVNPVWSRSGTSRARMDGAASTPQTRLGASSVSIVSSATADLQRLRGGRAGRREPPDRPPRATPPRRQVAARARDPAIFDRDDRWRQRRLPKPPGDREVLADEHARVNGRRRGHEVGGRQLRDPLPVQRRAGGQRELGPPTKSVRGEHVADLPPRLFDVPVLVLPNDFAARAPPRREAADRGWSRAPTAARPSRDWPRWRSRRPRAVRRPEGRRPEAAHPDSRPAATRHIPRRRGAIEARPDSSRRPAAGCRRAVAPGGRRATCNSTAAPSGSGAGKPLIG